MTRPSTRSALAAFAVALLVALAPGCSDDGSSSSTDGGDTTTTTDASGASGGPSTTAEEDPVPAETIVFNGQGNDLVAYQGEEPYESQRVITNATDDPEAGRDINAQICLWEEDGVTRMIAGEDTGQPDPPAGWGIFEVDGGRVGELSATQVGKLTPTYQEGAAPENYGCGILSDGRIVTTDIGNQAAGPNSGQLIIWFPPFDSYEVSYCKLDVAIGTAQSIVVDEDDNVYVTSARGSESEPPGVYRFSGPFPTSDDAEGGCGQTDATGAPLADEVQKELFIPASDENGLATPAGLAPAPNGGFYVSSVFTGVINEYDADGEFLQTILEPPEGETIGAEPYSTGTPLGIGVGPDGSIYYADIGIVVAEGELPGPGDATGSVRRIQIVDGEPQPPETMATGLAFPDGIGVWFPGSAASPAPSPA